MTDDIRNVPTPSRSVTTATLAILALLSLASAFMSAESRAGRQGARNQTDCIVAAIDDGRFPDRTWSAEEALVRRKCGISASRPAS